MPRFEVTTEVRASPELCFDLSRDLDLHLTSMAHTGEQIVGGRRSGVIELGEHVTWRGRHFGFVHEHTSLITAFDRPRHFRDEMTEGRFARFVHDHYFELAAYGTRVLDIVEFESPLGWLGRVVDSLVLRRYLTRLIEQRAEAVRLAAEEAAQRQLTRNDTDGHEDGI